MLRETGVVLGSTNGIIGGMPGGRLISAGGRIGAALPISTTSDLTELAGDEGTSGIRVVPHLSAIGGALTGSLATAALEAGDVCKTCRRLSA